jgi:hypothetical protein
MADRRRSTKGNFHRHFARLETTLASKLSFSKLAEEEVRIDQQLEDNHDGAQ